MFAFGLFLMAEIVDPARVWNTTITHAASKHEHGRCGYWAAGQDARNEIGVALFGQNSLANGAPKKKTEDEVPSIAGLYFTTIMVF